MKEEPDLISSMQALRFPLEDAPEILVTDLDALSELIDLKPAEEDSTIQDRS